MKLALIFPRFKYPSGDPPTGLLYIISHLKANSNCDVTLIDTTFMKSPLRYIKQVFSAETYDIAGISLMTTMLSDAVKVAEIIKQVSPNTKIIFGGPHPTVMPDETLEYDCVDAVAIGEGEETLLDIVKSGGDFESVRGLWYKSEGKVVKNQLRQPILNLDRLEFPDRSVLDMPKYFRNWIQLESVGLGLRGVNIFASRGCPYNCSYCQPTLRKIFGVKVRTRSPRNIVNEIEAIKTKYHIDAFMFVDDTFIFDREWVMQICDEIIKRKLNIIWGCLIRANLADITLFSKMYEAGLRKVSIGIESGSQRILDEVYQKRITLEQVRYAVRILHQLNIRIQGFFMVGAPSETREEIERTIRFAKELDIDEATFSVTTPLPHTYLYEKTKQLINKPLTDFDYYKSTVYQFEKGLTNTEILRLKRKAYVSFYLSKKRFVFTFKSLLHLNKAIAKLKRF